MKNIKKIGLLIAFISVFAACKKDAPSISLSTEKELLTFRLEAASNAGLETAVVAEVGESEIEFQVPAGTALNGLVATFTFKGEKVLIGNTEQQSGETANDFSKAITYVVYAEDGSTRNYKVEASVAEEPQAAMAVARISIQTDGGVPVLTKDYLDGDIKVEAIGDYAAFEASTRIKGRGNSTWGYDKKPYKIKLDKKASLLGFKEAREFVLLANYLDGTLMLNAVAMKAGQLIGLPYTNTIVPVDLTINGVYMGSYSLTEQVEVHENRVAVKDGGVLLELDTYFDEPFKFSSSGYNLPVMVKYPALEDYSSSEANAELEKIQSEFEAMEQLVKDTSFPGNNYQDKIDRESLVKYLIIYNLTDNEEINHPKSIYMHKAKGGKYTMGPLWDFDWAYGYEQGNKHFDSFSHPLFWSNRPSSGNAFFTRLLQDPDIRGLYRQRWNEFRSDHLPKLLTYVTEYAETISESQQRDYSLWKRGNGFAQDVAKLRAWLENRAGYIDSYTASW